MIAKYVSDKTSWQQMLKSHVEPIDLVAKRDALVNVCKAELTEVTQRFGQQAIDFFLEEPIMHINFPVDSYPVKIKSFNFINNPEVSGILHGIKGHYLMLDTGVINIPKLAGYDVEFSMEKIMK